MVEDHKKSESEEKVKQEREIYRLGQMEELHSQQIRKLQKRVRELQFLVEALKRGDNTGFKHENDGGWFD